ncbi:MAG: response regulator [Proteobacteria bacterium]|nr:response regulator [Pseudomonadota bacterium]
MHHDDLAGLSVLVVEDEFLIADFIAETITGFGARVVGPVGSAAQARALLKDARIDGAVLDVRLDGHTSLPLADELLEAGIPVIFASGYGASLVPAKYDQVPLLNKPFRQDEVLATAKVAFAQALAQSRGA